MLIAFQAALGTEVDARDGNVGSLDDLLFDRRLSWPIRYLAVTTGGWLANRRVLLTPLSVVGADWTGRLLKVGVTCKEVRHSPEVDEHRPLSRQKEYALARHFGWKPYWLPGPIGLPDGPGLDTPTEPERTEESDEPDLWNANELIGYHVHAMDGDIGPAEDLLIDDRSWTVRYLVVDIGNRITGRRVLVAPAWTESIDWDAREVVLSLSRQEVEESPEFDPAAPVNRDYENRLYDYYGRPKYWDNE